MSDEETYAIGAQAHVAEALQEGGPFAVDDVVGPVLPDLYEVTVSRPAYETKTIRFHLEERGQYLFVVLTRFDGERNMLGEIGYRGEYIIYQTMGQSHELQVSGVDLFAMAEEHPFPLARLYPFDLLYALDTGDLPWEAITDGDRLTEADVDELLAEHDEVEADA